MNWRTATEGCIYHYPILGGSSYKYGQLYTSYKSVISHNWRMNGLWFMNVCDSIYGLWFRNGLWCTVCKSVIYNSIYGLWMFMTFPFNPQPYRNHIEIIGQFRASTVVVHFNVKKMIAWPVRWGDPQSLWKKTPSSSNMHSIFCREYGYPRFELLKAPSQADSNGLDHPSG